MNVVIIYDHPDLAVKSNAVLARAAHRADQSLHPSVKPWPVDLMLHPVAAAAMGEEAANAHLLVLAIRGAEELPAWLLDWLENWAAHRQVHDAAIAVYDGTEEETWSAAAPPALAGIAARNDLDFIHGSATHTSNSLASLQTRQDLRHRETAQTAVLHTILSQPPAYTRHWGINE